MQEKTETYGGESFVKESSQIHHCEDGSTADEVSVEHVPEGTSSPGKALFMLLKAFIGTGVIFLPGSFASGGLILSIVLMVTIGVICMFSFQRLVQAQRLVGGSYGNVAEVLVNKWARYLINFFLCVSQMGFVASYMIFISENVGIVVDTLSNCNAPFAAHFYIWIFLIIIIPLCWVRKIGRIGWCAIIADVFILFGLVCVIYFSSAQISHQGGMGPNITMVNAQTFALMLGTAVFSFEGIGMVVPIITGMREPEKFKHVLNIGMVICIVVFTGVGALGYVAYGNTIQASIVSNLPRQPLSIVVQLLYSVAMILTSPFMLYPPLTIIESAIFKPHHRGKISLKWKWLKNLVRTIIPVVCAAISFGVGPDGLNKFVALVGSVGSMPLCFVFPGWFHYKISKSKTQKAMDIVLILFGIAIAIYTMYVNIDSWVHPTPSTPAPSTCPA
ncbi:transmembrane amino acid transporter protein-domain-containing protein [Gongronella butleri]|nr:transmembrane amino acid transporter protein-domain-containing protein [Gongronella butleri]